jgi:tRNA(adenine34) deaminase
MVGNELQDWMREALAEARKAAKRQQVPVGCIVLREGKPLARAHNARRELADPTAHAEMLALREAAGKVGDWRLDDATVVCTLEPCCMCAGALVNARVVRLVYGLSDPKSGACGSVVDIPRLEPLNHHVEVIGGVLEDEVLALMRKFFAARR